MDVNSPNRGFVMMHLDASNRESGFPCLLIGRLVDPSFGCPTYRTIPKTVCCVRVCCWLRSRYYVPPSPSSSCMIPFLM